MLSRLTRFVVGLVVAAFACSAMADSVSYHTVVFFLAPVTNGSLSGNSVVGIDGSGKDSLSGTGSLAGDTVTAFGEKFSDTDMSADGPAVDLSPIVPLPATFGHFGFDGSAPGSISANIEIDVYQDSTDPGGASPGQGTFVGSAKANFVFVRAANHDNVILTIQQPLTMLLPPNAGGFPPGVFYTIDGPTQTVSNNGGLFEISGNVAEAPVPATASLGLSLLGGLGCVQMWSLRRRRASVAA
jgi:hypothetical protein